MTTFAASGGIRAGVAVAIVLAVAAASADERMGMAIYAGSRGTGVPEAARSRLLDIERYLVDAQRSAPGAFRFRKSVVGLEGETMLCIVFDDPARREPLLARLQPMVAAVPLLSMGRSTCSVD